MHVLPSILQYANYEFSKQHFFTDMIRKNNKVGQIGQTLQDNPVENQLNENIEHSVVEEPKKKINVYVV